MDCTQKADDGGGIRAQGEGGRGLLRRAGDEAECGQADEWNEPRVSQHLGESGQGMLHSAHRVTASEVVCARLFFFLRQASEQYKTWSQFFSHALRHVMVRPHTVQGLLGSERLLPLNVVDMLSGFLI